MKKNVLANSLIDSCETSRNMEQKGDQGPFTFILKVFMDLSNAYKKLWKNSFNFKGTATRSEYWWIVLINFMIIYSLTLFGEELEMYLRQYTICT